MVEPEDKQEPKVLQDMAAISPAFSAKPLLLWLSWPFNKVMDVVQARPQDDEDEDEVAVVIVK
jgi:hypothetical protein